MCVCVCVCVSMIVYVSHSCAVCQPLACPLGEKKGLASLAEGNTSMRERRAYEAEVESNKAIVLH